MSGLTPTGLGFVALAAGSWLALTLWLSIAALRRERTARARIDDHDGLAALLSATPDAWLLIRRDGRFDYDRRVTDWLSLEKGCERFVDFCAAAFQETEGEALAADFRRTASTGSEFERVLSPKSGNRTFRFRGGPAPPAFPPGTILVWIQDVTDVETDKARLREESEQLGAALEALSGLIEAAPFPIWHRGPDLRLTLVNSAYVQAVEGGDALAVIRSGIELIDEIGGRSPLDQARAVRDEEESAVRTVPATMAGQRRMMRVVEVPLGPAGVGGFAIDVEEREQARADLVRFVTAQRAMLDRLSAGVAQFGPDRSLIFSNHPFVRLFGLSGEFLANRPEFNRVLDAMREGGHLPEVRDFPTWKDERGRWFTSGLAADEEDWLLPGGNHLRVVAQPLPDGGLLIIFEDRTEQIQLASARDTLLRVRSATFDNLFEAVGVFASDGRLHLWNNRFRELWQFEEELLARNPRIDSLTQHIARMLKNPGHAGLVRELVRSATIERKQRGGRVSLTDGRDFEFAAVPLPDGNALFTMLDITASRSVETALRERNEALEQANRMKTAFVSNMSYELRTPLTSIAGFAEMLDAGYAGPLSQAGAEYVRAIRESSTRLGILIDNVLDLTESDTGALVLADDDVDLADLCGEAASGMRDSAAAKGIEIATRIKASVGKLSGDRRRLRQALDNLLGNAVAYTDPGGRILIEASGRAREAVISVSDTGRGMDSDAQAVAFDRFARSAEARQNDDASLGLGLPIAKEFVVAHGGRIELQSEPDKGTVIVIHLPRSR